MSKHTLFVCQSCDHSFEERSENQPADGDRLLKQHPKSKIGSPCKNSATP